VETEVIAHEAVREDTPEKEETEAAVLEEDGMMVIPETEKVASVEVLLDAETAQTNIPEIGMRVILGQEKEAIAGGAAKVGTPGKEEAEAAAQGAKEVTPETVKGEGAARKILTEVKLAKRVAMEASADGTAHLTGTARKNIPPEIEMMIQQAAQLNLELALTEANSLKKQKSKQLKFYEAEICISLTSQIALMKKSGLQTSLLSA